MKLKSVELIGFKSFARKTKINFHPGITEIVGPNGSGKSNIIEAIRWALGEQSAKNLRSSRMTDVIFSGSQSHPALNRAKVTLDFDNRDYFIHTNYSDLTISRSVYRDGTNNYYINNEPCRLRDVQNLFMNTGIGNGSFSIISQGKVSQIFKSKPEDRRFIVETVAGIYKYRSQKEVASKKLKRVNDNLDRLQDINYELEKQLHRLSVDREKATQYLKQKRVANRLDTDRLLVRFHHLNQKKRRGVKAYQQFTLNLDKLIRRINQLKRIRSDVQTQIKQTSKRSELFQDRILQVSHRLDVLSNQLNLNHQKITFWRKQIKRNLDQITKANQVVDALNTRVFKLSAHEKQDRHKVQTLKEQLRQTQQPRTSESVKDAQKQIQQLHLKYLRFVKKSVAINGQITNLRQNKRNRKIRLTQAKGQLSQIQALNRKVDHQVKSVNQDLESLKQIIKDDLETLAQLNSRQTEVNRRFQTERRKYQIHSRKKQILLIRLNGLKRLANNHANLNYGSRNLLNHADRFSGILGPVAKFIRVPDKYIRAIEATLGGQLQQIIVNDIETAKQAVRFMTAHRLGRVTLLPIDDLSKRWVDALNLRRCYRCEGFIGVAANLVKMPENFSAVKTHLLGNVLITRDISSAINVSHVVYRRYRVVTLDGNVVNAGGAITGGHGRYRNHGLLSQKAKFNQYQQMVTKLGQNERIENTKFTNLQKQLNQLNQKLEITRSGLNQKRQRYSLKINLQKRLINEERNYQKLLDERQQLANVYSNDDQRASLSTLLAVQSKIKAKMSSSHRQLATVQNKLNQKTNFNNQVIRRYQNLRETLIKTEDKLNQNTFKRTSLANKLKRTTQEVDHYNQANSRLKRLITQQHLNPNHNKHLKKIQTKIDNLRTLKTKCHQKIAQEQKNLTTMESRLNDNQEHLITLRNQINRNHLNRHELDRKQREVLETLLRKYQINLVKHPLPVPKVSLYQISSELLRVQKQLQKIGPVNVNSIARFKKVNHRYQFLSKQVNDLFTSKHQLIATMNQMDSKIISRFKTTFKQINQAFKVTYSQIFRGGRAKLSLVDPHHLLTTGIDIKAQPPGKRYRNMELLSGGERALTAIALLFAILKIKPAPFCILDEAESALDAINIDRFGNYMQKLKAKTQFIVITHRKTTMLYADNLYGVTMQNSGISKIISVNLHKAKIEG